MRSFYSHECTKQIFKLSTWPPVWQYRGNGQMLRKGSIMKRCLFFSWLYPRYRIQCESVLARFCSHLPVSSPVRHERRLLRAARIESAQVSFPAASLALHAVFARLKNRFIWHKPVSKPLFSAGSKRNRSVTQFGRAQYSLQTVFMKLSDSWSYRIHEAAITFIGAITGTAGQVMAGPTFSYPALGHFFTL